MGSLPLEGRAGEGVVLWSTNGPPPSIPPLKGEGGRSGPTNIDQKLNVASAETRRQHGLQVIFKQQARLGGERVAIKRLGLQ